MDLGEEKRSSSANLDKILCLSTPLSPTKMNLKRWSYSRSEAITETVRKFTCKRKRYINTALVLRKNADTERIDGMKCGDKIFHPTIFT